MSGHCEPVVITRPLGSQRRLAAFSQIYRHAPLLRGRYFSAGTGEVCVTADLLLGRCLGSDRAIAGGST